MPSEAPPDLSPADLQARLAGTELALETLRRQQEVLAHGLSHDLRAPLRAIGGYARVLIDGHTGELDVRGRGYLERIGEAVARMEALIEGLLQLSHATRAPLRPAPVDLGLLVEWSLAELQDAEPERPAELAMPPELTAHGDERLLKTLFEQLLRNAWNFSRDRDRVRIEVQGERRGDRVQVSVRDHGRGFDMEYAERMFEPFQRLHGPEQGGGHGLGLAIARCIVERHDGRIWAESTPDAGSVFHVELPAAPGAGSGA